MSSFILQQGQEDKEESLCKNIKEFHQFPEGLSSTFDIQIAFFGSACVSVLVNFLSFLSWSISARSFFASGRTLFSNLIAPLDERAYDLPLISAYVQHWEVSWGMADKEDGVSGWLGGRLVWLELRYLHMAHWNLLTHSLSNGRNASYYPSCHLPLTLPPSFPATFVSGG